jgi:hypothetical protein
MSKIHEVRDSGEISAPQSTVWARVSNHVDSASWVEPVKQVTLDKTGTPSPNGVGAVRVVKFKSAKWPTVYEEITAYEAPSFFHYTVIKGMPGLKDSLGKVCVDDLGDGRSRLRLEADFEFSRLHPFNLLVPRFLREFEETLTNALAELKRQLEIS